MAFASAALAFPHPPKKKRTTTYGVGCYGSCTYGG